MRSGWCAAGGARRSSGGAGAGGARAGVGGKARWVRGDARRASAGGMRWTHVVMGVMFERWFAASERRWRREGVLALLFLGLLVTRLCHLDIVWVEEGYPSAAAIQVLDGKALYRDVWFDKPPLSPFLYLLWGAQIGWPLRIAGAIFVWLCCLLAYRFGREAWGEREGIAAALLLGFFLTFGIPSAVIALAPDLLMVLPHLAAIYLVWRRQPFAGGLAAAAATLVNPRGFYIFVACFAWLRYRDVAKFTLAFLVPNIAALAWFGQPYLDEVWRWGIVYAANTFVAHPAEEGARRTLDWLGFQSALALGAGWWLWRERTADRWRFAFWTAAAFFAVMAGWRFFPRYYFILLVPFVMMAARGYVLMASRRVILIALLIIPLVRFGPRYVELANDLVHGRRHRWTDLAMMYDSEDASHLIEKSGAGTLLVWGYRPDIFAFTRMEAGTRYLDSQPLTGVLADRHLVNSEALTPELAARNREDLRRTRPTFIADGLGLLNPRLAINGYPDLSAWLRNYREVGRTRDTIVYKLAP